MSGVSVFLVVGGLWNVVDGVWSLLHPRLGHWWFSDLARIGRLVIGIGLLFLGVCYLIVDVIEK